MTAPVILITASSALADGWADSLGLQDALRLSDLAALNRASVAADSLVLLDLAAPAPASRTCSRLANIAGYWRCPPCRVTKKACNGCNTVPPPMPTP